MRRTNRTFRRDPARLPPTRAAADDRAAFASLSIDMYLPSFPTLEKDLHTNSSLVQFSLAAFFVGMALGQALYGPLADRFGRKRPLYAGISLYVLASAGCALAK